MEKQHEVCQPRGHARTIKVFALSQFAMDHDQLTMQANAMRASYVTCL